MTTVWYCSGSSRGLPAASPRRPATQSYTVVARRKSGAFSSYVGCLFGFLGDEPRFHWYFRGEYRGQLLSWTTRRNGGNLPLSFRCQVWEVWCRWGLQSHLPGTHQTILPNGRIYDPTKENKCENYYYSLLLLFVPFRNQADHIEEGKTAESTLEWHTQHFEKLLRMLMARECVQKINEARKAKQEDVGTDPGPVDDTSVLRWQVRPWTTYSTSTRTMRVMDLAWRNLFSHWSPTRLGCTNTWNPTSNTSWHMTKSSGVVRTSNHCTCLSAGWEARASLTVCAYVTKTWEDETQSTLCAVTALDWQHSSLVESPSTDCWQLPNWARGQRSWLLEASERRTEDQSCVSVQAQTAHHKRSVNGTQFEPRIHSPPSWWDLCQRWVVWRVNVVFVRDILKLPPVCSM